MGASKLFLLVSLPSFRSLFIFKKSICFLTSSFLLSWVFVQCFPYQFQLCLYLTWILEYIPILFQFQIKHGEFENCRKYTGENLCRNVISIMLLCNFIKITLRYACSLVNLLYIFRTPFYKNTSGGLLLNIFLNAYICQKLSKKTCQSMKYTLFFHKQPVCKQLSGLNPLSLSNDKNYRLKKSGVFHL